MTYIFVPSYAMQEMHIKIFNNSSLLLSDTHTAIKQTNGIFISVHSNILGCVESPRIQCVRNPKLWPLGTSPHMEIDVNLLPQSELVEMRTRKKNKWLLTFVF